MSLSRPVRFPVLKLPYLCIEAVIKNCDVFDKIFFALLSERTRRIVKSMNIPLNGIEVMVSKRTFIRLGRFYKNWNFNKTSSESLSDQNSGLNPLVLQKNAVPLYTNKMDRYLQSYTDQNEFIALKMTMEFLHEIFKCSVERVDIYGRYCPKSFGVKSTLNLYSRYGQTRNQNLSLLLENLEVTGKCSIWVSGAVKDFFCDPKLFKCKTLIWSGSAAWVTQKILLQLEVPQLIFLGSLLPVENILPFVTNWYHSDNKKLEYLYISFQNRRVSLEEFQTAELDLLPFSERSRVPQPESFENFDFSNGLEIVRHDGLQATIHVNELRKEFLFYIWHDQTAITQN